MVSLLCPTRNRPQNIVDLIKNVSEMITSWDNVELLFMIDSDDTRSAEILNRYVNEDFNVAFKVREKSDFLNRDYYNELAKWANGSYLWGIGDDVRFLTKSFDSILEIEIEQYLKTKLDRLLYINVQEVDSFAKHPCFPLLTKEVFNFLGMYFHPQLLSWGADRTLWEIYSSKEVDRTLFIPTISIEHLSYHDKKAPYDETAKSMKERFFRNPDCHNEVSRTVVPEQIIRIKEYIKQLIDIERARQVKESIH